MAVILDIADAVVDQLNATTFSQALTAERHYQPRFELSEMTELKVSIVPRSILVGSFPWHDDGAAHRSPFNFLRSSITLSSSGSHQAV
jgi:hypothetical protein